MTHDEIRKEVDQFIELVSPMINDNCDKALSAEFEDAFKKLLVTVYLVGARRMNEEAMKVCTTREKYYRELDEPGRATAVNLAAYAISALLPAEEK